MRFKEIIAAGLNLVSAWIAVAVIRVAVKQNRNTARRLVRFNRRAAHSAPCCVLRLMVFAVVISNSGWTQAMASGAEPTPKPAVDAILSAFDKYKIVAIPAAHGQKDLDDFILMLVRDQRLPLIVNDIAVECGNSIYQQILDRYIAGEEVPFSEVRKVWRNTTQGLLCGTDGFYETFYPLIRAINQKLPADKRLRVLAAAKAAKRIRSSTCSKDVSGMAKRKVNEFSMKVICRICGRRSFSGAPSQNSVEQ